MTAPLVSVAVPAYNHAKYIEACLASVCAQTYPELELVVIDDGSQDDTLQVAERFLDRHRGRFRRVALTRQKNQGVSATSNACIEACQGEWVHLLGSDDVLYPDKIGRIQQSIIEWACEDLALVHTDADFIDEHGDKLAQRRRKPRSTAGIDRHAYRWLFFGEHSVINPTIALKREPFLSIGGFDRDLALEDLDCWLRLSVRFATARLPEVLACYRKHPGNTLRRRVKMLAAQFFTYAKFLENSPGLISDAEVRRHFRRNLKRFWRRIRRQEPMRFPEVVLASMRSCVRTPQPENYRRFGRLLDKVAN